VQYSNPRLFGRSPNQSTLPNDGVRVQDIRLPLLADRFDMVLPAANPKHRYMMPRFGDQPRQSFTAAVHQR
jgi:hypothetical protein